MGTTKMRTGEPPPGRTTAHDWVSIAATLRSKPGVWHEVFTNDRYSLVAAVSTGSVTVFQSDSEGQFETRTCNNHNVEESDGVTRRHCDLWMQFVPTPTKRKGK